MLVYILYAREIKKTTFCTYVLSLLIFFIDSFQRFIRFFTSPACVRCFEFQVRLTFMTKKATKIELGEIKIQIKTRPFSFSWG